MKKNIAEPPLPEGQRLLSDELNELGHLRANKEKYNIEFNRYKQDCRKRALEMAHHECPIIQEEGKWIASTEQVMKKADEYYNWLISIPNDK